MKIAKQNSTSRRGGLYIVMLLGIILSVLFCKSFLPDYVHFSNDGPLGPQSAAWLHLPGAMNGMWDDLNSIGFSGGSYPPSVSMFIRWILGPVGYAKFYAPIALFILGCSAWVFFRQLRLSPLAATLGALATTFNSAYFATACWGVASQQIAIGIDFLALALLVSNTSETPIRIRWMRLVLAGLAVGVNVMEASDIGAILSLFIAAFVFYKAIMNESGPALVKAVHGIGRVAVIAIFAGFIATQTIVSLVGSQISGISGTGQDTETKEQHWSWATQWSLPKPETLSLFVPGLFGYKMDTPDGMMEFLQQDYKGGNYWGGVGRDPALDAYLSGERKGPLPQGFMRFTGGQNYAGILVVLVALWTIAQSLRRQNSVFPETQRRFIWFWAVVLVVSLLLAWGRFAPFYKFLYMLPYFSTIRNPIKFLIVFSWAIIILFAYGIDALSRRHLETAGTGKVSFKMWWAKACDFDRKWILGCGGALVLSVFAWLIYAQQEPALISYLQKVGFADEDMAAMIAGFSIRQAGWFLVFFALAIGLVLLVITGVFAGKRAKLGAVLLGAFLLVDLGRADLPYIIHWNYVQKYDIDPANPANSTNPIINFLRAKPWEHRTIGLPFNVPAHLPFFDSWVGDLYRIEWAQHHFPYYNIQSLDKIQMSRMPTDLMAYEVALTPRSESTEYLLARHWELTNTRYLIGPVGFLDVLNERLDPAQHRFRIVQRFDVVAKPGIEQVTQLEQMTAVVNEDGGCALFEFTGALPRAKLYSHWQISTNDDATLQTLASTNFDAWQTVLVSTPLPVTPAANTTNENSGTVEYKSYAPKRIVLDANATGDSVLLLNDKYDPNWHVSVDGKPAELLRCNFIMRGVNLTPGAHVVEFQFSLPNKPLYVTLLAIGVGILLCGFLMVSTRRHPKPTAQP